LNDSIIFSLANFTNILQITKEKFPNISNQEFVNILRQKLYDIYYLCEDSRDLHGVIDCHNFVKLNQKNLDEINNFQQAQTNDVNLFPLEIPQIFNKEYIPCNNLASFFCSNHMCKKCCELNTNILFMMIL